MNTVFFPSTSSINRKKEREGGGGKKKRERKKRERERERKIKNRRRRRRRRKNGNNDCRFSPIPAFAATRHQWSWGQSRNPKNQRPMKSRGLIDSTSPLHRKTAHFVPCEKMARKYLTNRKP